MAVKKIKDSSGTEHVIDATLWNSCESPEAMGLLSGVKNITYSELVGLRDNSNLAPGQQYRITDYMTTTKQRNTQSAGHQFDIIVTADSNNTLNEVARACKHVNDTYFATENLNAWQIWYCLDNDIERFAWADTTNGKGVIYRMIDEYNNECPYDFKNIMFKKYLYYDEKNSYYWKTIRDIEGEEGDFSDNEFITVKSAFCYTFTYNGNQIRDLSIVGNNSLYDETDGIPGVKDNIIKKCLGYFNYDAYMMDTVQRLNNIVFFVDQTDDWFGGVLNNTCGYNCMDIYLNGSNGYFGNNNHIGDNCYDIYFNGDNDNNNFGDVCTEISIGTNSYINSFGNNCYNIYIGDNCVANSFGNTCSNIQIGNECRFNKFENRCVNIRFGSNCSQNSFGNNCSQIYFGQTASKLKSNYRNIIIDNGNCNIYLNCTSTTSSSKNYQNVRIGLGVNNTTTYKTISDSNVNQTYETLYLPKNSQTIAI